MNDWMNGRDDGSETVRLDWLKYSPCIFTRRCKPYPLGTRIRSGGLYTAENKISHFNSLDFSWEKRRKLRSSIDGESENLWLTETAGNALYTRCDLWHLVSLWPGMLGGVCCNDSGITTRNWRRRSTKPVRFVIWNGLYRSGEIEVSGGHTL